MADFQTGQAIAVDYMAESTFGTLASPASGARRFRLAGGGMTPASDVIESPEFRSDGQTILPRLGMKSGTGGYNGQMSVGTYDPLFEALLRGTWTSDVLIPATTQVNRSFSFEEYRSIIQESIRYLGCRVSSCKVSLPANGPCTVDFGILGRDYAIVTGGGAKYFTSPTVTSTEGMVATDAVCTYNGSPFVSFTSCEFTIDLRAANQAVVGSRLTPDVFTSAMRIAGSLSAVRSDTALLTQFVAETAVGLQFTLTDVATPTLSHIFYLPKIRLTGHAPSMGTDGPEIVTLPFTAGYDTGIGAMIRMTRDITP